MALANEGSEVRRAAELEGVGAAFSRGTSAWGDPYTTDTERRGLSTWVVCPEFLESTWGDSPRWVCPSLPSEETMSPAHLQ